MLITFQEYGDINMKENCIFCNNYHDEIYQRFERFFNKVLDDDNLVEFIRFTEFELQEKNWNELFCLLDTMWYNIYSDNNYHDNYKLKILIGLLREQMISNPEMSSLKKIKETIKTNNSLKRIMNTRIKSNKNADFQQEYDHLLNLGEEITKKPELGTPLKNYIILRLMSIFEQRIHETLVNVINAMPRRILQSIKGHSISLDTDYLTNFEEINIGKIAVQGLDNNTYRIDDLIVKILQFKEHLIERNNYPKSSFFDYFGKVVTIKDPMLKDYFSKSHNNKWDTFIKNVNVQRNQCTHELTDVSCDEKELKHILQLMFIFLNTMPHLLHCIIDYYDGKVNLIDVKKSHEEMMKNMDSHKYASIKSYKESIEQLKVVFERV